jgi:hypothetical protein
MVKPWMGGRSLGLGASRLKRTDDGLEARSADKTLGNIERKRSTKSESRREALARL